jgi:hypothetical protein
VRSRLLRGVTMKIVETLQRIPWSVLLPVALLLGLAPFQPEPHLLEKLRLLSRGQLVRPLDIFDLLLHGLPLLIVFGKLFAGRAGREPQG